MAKQTINVGTTVNDGTGSPIRTGGQFINANFTEVYNALGDGSTITFNSATVASLTGVETLTNKTILLANNTITGTTAEFNTALSDNSFATLAGTEALTNKTFNTTNTFPALSLLDESSSAGTVSLGGTLRINGHSSIAAAVSGSTFTISLQSGIDATKIADGSVSSTEFQYLNGVTSNIQTQIDAISGGLPSLIAAIALG